MSETAKPRRHVVTALIVALVLSLITGAVASTCFAVQSARLERQVQGLRQEVDDLRREAEAQRELAILQRERAENLVYAAKLAAAQIDWQRGSQP